MAEPVELKPTTAHRAGRLMNLFLNGYQIPMGGSELYLMDDQCRICVRRAGQQGNEVLLVVFGMEVDNFVRWVNGMSDETWQSICMSVAVQDGM